jgi:hypothetical protein
MLFITILKIFFAAIIVAALLKYLFSKKTRKENPDAMDGLNSVDDIL